MTDETRQHADALQLSEDAAHRLLARAVELDAARGASLSTAQLREVASDAATSVAAFGAAGGELARGTDPPPRARRGVGRWRTLRDVVARNALALAGAWAILSLATGVA